MTTSDSSAAALPVADEQALAQLEACIRGRRTVVLFEDRPVPPALVERAVELASWAPNHHLTEPWHFHAIGAQTRTAMIELIRLNAEEARGPKVAVAKARRAEAVPGWLAVSCALAEKELTQQEDLAATACAIQNLSLYLWQAGVGMKWSTGAVTRDPRFYELLRIDANERTIVGLISYGYPKHVPEPRPRQGGEALLSHTP
ncbi:MAG: nitroreductase [Pseudomonadota bacterium]